nr:lignin-forming anionic peroxidase-like [Tanacetum cinerariifolium]GEX43852.1 lignin-forming anionic peroxidase-like [Tanacetum cinerariifolium]
MLDEYNALITNGTWVLVPHPTDVNVVRSMWIFKHKFHADGSLSRYKALLGASRCSQQHGIDCDETFSVVVKPTTIRTVLSLAISRDCPIHQLDVKNAFLHDLGSLNDFLGISAQRSSLGIFLSQSKFTEEIFERAHMQNCNMCKNPVDTESKFGSDGDPISNPTLYRSHTGALQCLTFIRPDLSYVVQQVCLYMHDPRDPHFTALKRILRYVRGTLDYGLQLHVSSTTQLTAYTDADWAGCPVTRRSTSGYCVFLGDNLLSWSAKRQVTLSRSSAKAEYRGIANVVAQTAWIHNLLCELHTPLFTATPTYCDNGLATALFLEFCSILNVQRPPISTTGETSIRTAISRERRMEASILHLHFHDCFVQGCDASILLDDSPTIISEKNALPNKGSVRGYEVIEAAKSEVEKLCPGVVSCADILNVATCDATEMVGGPSWSVKLGRRDSTTASHILANTGLPSFKAPLDSLISTFNGSDIDAGFASICRRRCPINKGNENLAALDLVTPNSFNNNYFENLIQKKGLLESDQALFSGGSTDSIVREYNNDPSKFKSDFAAAIVKTSEFKTTTGQEGVIRRICGALP